MIVSWDWKAGAKDIAERLNEALRIEGSDIRAFKDRDYDGDNVQILLLKVTKQTLLKMDAETARS